MLHRFLPYILFISLLFFSKKMAAQEVDKLAIEREALLKEINKTTQLLNRMHQAQASALDNYYTLQKQLERRARLISSIQKEIQLTERKVEQSAIAVDSLELAIEALKVEYGTILRQAFRQKMSRNDLLFLFSASSFNQALKRWRYMQQYEEYRKKQVALIVETKDALKTRIVELSANKQKQEQLLIAEESQKDAVKEELLLKNTLLKALKEEEEAINQLLQKQTQAHQELFATLESTISDDLKEASENKERSAGVSKNDLPKVLSSNLTHEFTIKKGKLTWPLQNGIIVRYFGNQPHPIHKKILINNNGIDIQARSNRTVFSLFEGIVTAIQVVPGYQNTIILKHGEYYTVYANLEAVKVKKGDLILPQQAIGIAGIPPQKNKPEVHLEIWKGKQRLNPFSWLKKL